MSNLTPAQEEFNELVAKNSASNTDSNAHPEDREDSASDNSDISEEAAYRESQINAAMGIPTASTELNLPPISFDSGRSTGVKGVIADARSYETAKKSKWMARVHDVRRSLLHPDMFSASTKANLAKAGKSDSETDDDSSVGKSGDEEDFLAQWRETRRQELEKDAASAVRTRRTSPSMRLFGRLDEVDAMGYLDAIEKVGRETTVVVFVYDHEVRTFFSSTNFQLCRLRSETNIPGCSARYLEPLRLPCIP